jgi:methyl-accepting chemotaxis protein
MNEITFQIDLLTLNAAVQTACAGNAATGFARVADEMRNLSQWSAQAANQTPRPIAATAKHSAVTAEQLASHSQGLLALVTKLQSLSGATVSPEQAWAPPATEANGVPVRVLSSMRGRAAFPLDENRAGNR